MLLRRRSGRREIVLPASLDMPQRPARSQDPIVVALVRGHRWRDLLEARTYSNITALAEAIGVDPSYVGRHLNLTLLAPDIIETILLGLGPDGLTGKMLWHPPLSWAEQRKRLGFESPRDHEGLASTPQTRKRPTHWPDVCCLGAFPSQSYSLTRVNVATATRG